MRIQSLREKTNSANKKERGNINLDEDRIGGRALSNVAWLLRFTNCVRVVSSLYICGNETRYQAYSSVRWLLRTVSSSNISVDYCGSHYLIEALVVSIDQNLIWIHTKWEHAEPRQCDQYVTVFPLDVLTGSSRTLLGVYGRSVSITWGEAMKEREERGIEWQREK